MGALKLMTTYSFINYGEYPDKSTKGVIFFNMR